MNTLIWIAIGLIWSGISGSVGWVLKGHVDEVQGIAVAAHAEMLRIERDEARRQRDKLNKENATLALQHKAIVVHVDELVAQVEDRKERIDALELQLAEALKPRKRTRGQPVKAEVAE